tara:strand:- start:36 stop:215 length:180 start_codon:yes stop_codon:yes gene_type:complete
VLTIYQAKEIILQGAEENFCGNFDEEKLINYFFLDSKPEQKILKKSEWCKMNMDKNNNQ